MDTLFIAKARALRVAREILLREETLYKLRDVTAMLADAREESESKGEVADWSEVDENVRYCQEWHLDLAARGQAMRDLFGPAPWNAIVREAAELLERERAA